MCCIVVIVNIFVGVKFLDEEGSSMVMVMEVFMSKVLLELVFLGVFYVIFIWSVVFIYFFMFEVLKEGVILGNFDVYVFFVMF